MFKFERSAKKAKQPDVTPLIDVIFQLILFFMLTTTFVRMEAIDIFVNNKSDPVPQPMPAEAGFAAPVIVSLKGNDIFINNSKIAATEIPKVIGKEISLEKGRQVKLLTQEGVNMQQFVDAIDLIRAGGCENISLASAEAPAVATNSEDLPAPEKLQVPELKSTKKAKPGKASE